jgi:RimJ/RimL family protein N-acetyltransferase
MIEVPSRLEGSRVFLRPFREGDGAAVWSAVEESRAEIQQWEDWEEGHRSLDQSELAARRLRLKFLSREALYYGIWRKPDEDFLGWVGVENINWRIPSFDIGCWLRTSAAGNGYMTEAAALLCVICFETLNAKRVAFLAEAPNERSAAVARRLGFALEGLLRNNRLGVSGEVQSTLVFSLTPQEYQASSWKATAHGTVAAGILQHP